MQKTLFFTPCSYFVIQGTEVLVGMALSMDASSVDVVEYARVLCPDLQVLNEAQPQLAERIQSTLDDLWERHPDWSELDALCAALDAHSLDLGLPGYFHVQYHPLDGMPLNRLFAREGTAYWTALDFALPHLRQHLPAVEAHLKACKVTSQDIMHAIHAHRYPEAYRMMQLPVLMKTVCGITLQVQHLALQPEPDGHPSLRV